MFQTSFAWYLAPFVRSCMGSESSCVVGICVPSGGLHVRCAFLAGQQHYVLGLWKECCEGKVWVFCQAQHCIAV